MLRVLLLKEPLLEHITVIYFEVGVVTKPRKRAGHRLAMRDDEVAGEPVTRVEQEARMQFLHLLVVSNGQQPGNMTRRTFSTMRPYSAGRAT